ncbi:unnamed protein product [Closterium sp. NIES-54]
MLQASPQQNGIAERRIVLIHVAAPHFMWPFAVRYAAHQLNLWPRVSVPETSPTLRWTGEVGNASVFRVWGALSLVRDATAGKLSPRTLHCFFLDFPTDAPPWQFYHPSSRHVSSYICHLVSLAPLPRSPALLCTPCVEGWQRAAPHSSSLPPTTAPFQTLHLDVWGPSTVRGPRLLLPDCGGRLLPLHHGFSLATEGRASPQQNREAERCIGLVMEVARTSMCHAGAPQFWWPQAVRYATHQLNQWPSDTRPREMPVSLWTGSLGVAADFRVWGSLAHVRAPGANKLSARTRARVFLGFPLDASGWVFYDPVNYQFFASQDVTFEESICYYRSCPHRASPPFASYPVRCVARHSAVDPLHCPVLGVSRGAGGAVAEGEGTGAAGAGGVGSRGAGGVGVEFPPPSLRPVAAEPMGVNAGGTGGPGGVGGGGARSGGAGAGGNGTVAPTLRNVRFLTHEQRLLRLEREERERFERAQQRQQQQQQ